MLRIRNLSNMFQKRLIRPIYAQTQATPYAAFLHASLRNTDGSFRLPLAADTAGATPANAAGAAPLTRSANAASLQGGLMPGTVMVKGAGESMAVASGVSTAEQPFGLLANFVGGTMDDLGDENMIGVWRGPDSVFELLAPAFDDTAIAAAYASAAAGVPVPLFAGTDGRLTTGSIGSRVLVARLIERQSASKILIELVI